MSRARVVMVTAACLALAGCGGGGGSNDQGVSFQALGVFSELEKVAPEADEFDFENPLRDNTRAISLSETPVVPNDVNGDGDADGGIFGLQNNLDQSINVQGVTVEVFIAGARLPNPVVTDFVPFSISLAPVSVDDEGVRTPDVQYAAVFFLSADTMAFLNQNQTLLPSFPFDMSVVMTITGVSASGDSFDTNEITYPIVVVP